MRYTTEHSKTPARLLSTMAGWHLRQILPVAMGIGLLASTGLAQTPAAPAVKPTAPATAPTPPVAPEGKGKPDAKKPEKSEPTGKQQTMDDLQAVYQSVTAQIAMAGAYAEGAEKEGLGEAASLMRAIKRSNELRREVISAAIKKLGGTPQATSSAPATTGTTAEHAKALLEAVEKEKDKDIPMFTARTRGENTRDVTQALRFSREALREHATFLTDVRANPTKWKGKSRDFFVSRTCGYMVDKLDFQKCPVCFAARDNFEQVK